MVQTYKTNQHKAKTTGYAYLHRWRKCRTQFFQWQTKYRLACTLVYQVFPNHGKRPAEKEKEPEKLVTLEENKDHPTELTKNSDPVQSVTALKASQVNPVKLVQRRSAYATFSLISFHKRCLIYLFITKEVKVTKLI